MSVPPLRPASTGTYVALTWTLWNRLLYLNFVGLLSLPKLGGIVVLPKLGGIDVFTWTLWDCRLYLVELSFILGGIAVFTWWNYHLYLVELSFLLSGFCCIYMVELSYLLGGIVVFTWWNCRLYLVELSVVFLLGWIVVFTHAFHSKSSSSFMRLHFSVF